MYIACIFSLHHFLPSLSSFVSWKIFFFFFFLFSFEIIIFRANFFSIVISLLKLDLDFEILDFCLYDTFLLPVIYFLYLTRLQIFFSRSTSFSFSPHTCTPYATKSWEINYTFSHVSFDEQKIHDSFRPSVLSFFSLSLSFFLSPSSTN